MRKLLEWAQSRLENEIANNGIDADIHYWRGYIDALLAAEKAMRVTPETLPETVAARLREYAEWARGNEWEFPLLLGDDLDLAAAMLEGMCRMNARHRT